MTEINQPSIVGPLCRRSWRDIMLVRKLSTRSDRALVIEAKPLRVLPAGAGRTLSDFITKPYNFREIDPQPQTLPIAVQAESRDSSYYFNLAIEITYRASDLAKVSGHGPSVEQQLVASISESIAQISRSFGIEQTYELEANINEALIHGDVLRSRLGQLGVQMTEAEIRTDLSAEARAWIKQMREQNHERSIVDQFQVPSRDKGKIFNVHFTGSYSLRSDVASDRALEATEAVVCEALITTLMGVGRTFGIAEQREATQAMNQALRANTALHQALAAVEATLVRTNVRVQSQRALTAEPLPIRDPGQQATTTSDEQDVPGWLKLRAQIEESEGQ